MTQSCLAVPLGQAKGKDCLLLGQGHFSHIFDTDLGQTLLIFNG